MSWRVILALFGSWAVSLSFFLSVSLGLGAGIDVVGSRVFEMDVQRVVVHWTCKSVLVLRGEPHPLSRLFVTPMGSALRDWRSDGAETGRACRNSSPAALEVARLLTGVFMAVYVASTALLIAQLTGGSAAAALLGSAVCMVSFSSILLAAFPDSASLSGLATLFPLLFLNYRRKRPCTWAEVAGWALLGLFCIGVTITQVINWLIALAFRFRAWRLWHRSSSGAGTPSFLRLGAILALFLLSFVLALHLQRALYGGLRFRPSRLTREQGYSVFNPLANHVGPGTHVARVSLHFFGYNFAAPFPALSYRYVRLYPIHDRWMLSLIEAEPADWAPLQRGLAFLLLIGFAVGAAGVVRPDIALAAPLACVAAQLALHLLYGDEYILYSTNWHGALVAILITGVWRGGPKMRRFGGAVWAACAIGLFVNNVVVLNSVYTELEGGLEEVRRDAAGGLKHPPDGPLCEHVGILCPQRDS